MRTVPIYRTYSAAGSTRCLTRYAKPNAIPIGRYRGLDFGIVLHPGGAADIYLEGAAVRHGMLSRWPVGPRAVLNALERLSDTYGDQLATARRDLEIAQGQLRDYEARLGLPFGQKEYLEELTALRDQLKTALSAHTPEANGQPQPTAAELAERIQALKSSHTIDATPERPRSRNASAAEAITARIRRRTARQATAEPIPEAESDAPASELAIAATPPETPPPAVAAIPEVSEPAPAQPSGPELAAQHRSSASGLASPSAQLPGLCRTRQGEVRPPTEPILSLANPLAKQRLGRLLRGLQRAAFFTQVVTGVEHIRAMCPPGSSAPLPASCSDGHQPLAGDGNFMWRSGFQFDGGKERLPRRQNKQPPITTIPVPDRKMMDGSGTALAVTDTSSSEKNPLSFRSKKVSFVVAPVAVTWMAYST